MFLKFYWVLSLFLVGSKSNVYGQQTVGLFQNSPSSLNGYTLFSSNTDTYLIDNCGFIINQWQSDFNPGSSVYLLENGNLLRTARISGDFSGGGIGGRLELFDWESNLLWSFHYANEYVHQHHDIEPLPNGNILILAWEKKTKNEAIEIGRFPNSLTDAGLWPEHIIEIEMVGINEANIVWEWHLWDHLIQDFDVTKGNFGVLSDHPELIDINMNVSQSGGGGGANGADWVHANSISYNIELDQILLSSRNHHEIWIIDHSTSTEEAASHSGGNSGKGGDILYRWGNPKNYDQGDFANQKLWGQHDAKWIPNEYAFEGQIILFNNGQNRPGGSHSSVDILQPPLNSAGEYVLELNQGYGPVNLSWTYFSTPTTEFYSSNISGVQPLSNGNFLICEGREGRFFEVNAEKEVVWEYINPVSGNQIISQGQSPMNNATFRVTRYAEDYSGFEGKDLTPGQLIELNPLPSDCMIFDGTVDYQNEFSEKIDIRILGNPFKDFISIHNFSGKDLKMEIMNLFGEVVYSGVLEKKKNKISTYNWSSRVYFIRIFNEKSGNYFTRKLIKTN